MEDRNRPDGRHKLNRKIWKTSKILGRSEDKDEVKEKTQEVEIHQKKLEKEKRTGRKVLMDWNEVSIEE